MHIHIKKDLDVNITACQVVFYGMTLELHFISFTNVYIRSILKILFWSEKWIWKAKASYVYIVTRSQYWSLFRRCQPYSKNNKNYLAVTRAQTKAALPMIIALWPQCDCAHHLFFCPKKSKRGSFVCIPSKSIRTGEGVSNLITLSLNQAFSFQTGS